MFDSWNCLAAAIDPSRNGHSLRCLRDYMSKLWEATGSLPPGLLANTEEKTTIQPGAAHGTLSQIPSLYIATTTPSYSKSLCSHFKIRCFR